MLIKHDSSGEAISFRRQKLQFGIVLLFFECAQERVTKQCDANSWPKLKLDLKNSTKNTLSENEHFQLSMQIIGNIFIEQQNSTAATDQFETDENVPISDEETVGSVHTE
uniref:Uncharacterized protein n=1 Tax=Caenorhabditis japonica TaxID=281687 RepID=A0A8R1HH97_CAEJA